MALLQYLVNSGNRNGGIIVVEAVADEILLMKFHVEVIPDALAAGAWAPPRIENCHVAATWCAAWVRSCARSFGSHAQLGSCRRQSPLRG